MTKEGRFERVKETVMRHGMAMAIAGSTALGVEAGVREPAKALRAEATTSMRAAVLPLEHPTFGQDAEWFAHHPGGQYTEAERKARLQVLERGERIFHDVELDFYLVQPGDTIFSITKRLSLYPQYAYLARQQARLQSFNISPRELEARLWIPIPLENQDRHITDEQFVLWAREGLRSMVRHHGYGKEVAHLMSLSGMTQNKLIATALAVARQESGGNPLGTNEFHRWEGAGSHREFSFSMFHILMTPGGPGLRARKALMMTEGQTYHPTNATMLFVAFLIEKMRETTADEAGDLLPFDDPKKIERFSSFNNGRAWRSMNPRYTRNLSAFYADALTVVKSVVAVESAPAPVHIVEMSTTDQMNKGLTLEIPPQQPRRPRQDTKQVRDDIRSISPMMVTFAHGQTIHQAVVQANIASGNILQGSGVYMGRITGEVLAYLAQKDRAIDYRPGDRLGLAVLDGGRVAVVFSHAGREVRWVSLATGR